MFTLTKRCSLDGRFNKVLVLSGGLIWCDEDTLEVMKIPTRPGQFRSLKLALITATCIYLLLAKHDNDARHTLLKDMLSS